MVVDVVGLFDIVLFCDCVVVMLIWYFNLWVSFLYGNLSWFVQVILFSVEVFWCYVCVYFSEVGVLVVEECWCCFDVGCGLFIWFLFIELLDECWYLVIVVYYIVIDGWLLLLFVFELFVLYWVGGYVVVLLVVLWLYCDYIGWLVGCDQMVSCVMWVDYFNGLDGLILLLLVFVDIFVQLGILGCIEVCFDCEVIVELVDVVCICGVMISIFV